ncbi:unnamed protein product [Toxocara canis]|uniref:Secreted protein n=1 Tax=Toxocara canis TaxID=6265 RepID=A0A183TWT2_TOXCA|nr:unnamed protein product [Toxocara canis]
MFPLRLLCASRKEGLAEKEEREIGWCAFVVDLSTTWSMRNMSTSLNWSERYGGCGARRGNPQRTGIWSSRVICCASCTLKATAALLACNVRLLLRLAFGSSALSYLVWK